MKECSLPFEHLQHSNGIAVKSPKGGAKKHLYCVKLARRENNHACASLPCLNAFYLPLKYRISIDHRYVAVARFIAKYLGLPEERKAEYLSKQQGGHKALAVMASQLAETPYLVGEQLTIADISLYGYTHVAHEGGFDLSGYPAIQAWIARIASHPKYIAMS